MREDFAAFILTNRRPDRVETLKTLKKHGYTGKVYIVIDDEDPTAEEYIKRYSNKVLIFSKKDIAERFDEGDNFNDRRSIFYARNACFQLAEEVGVRFFVQLDDDYMSFAFRFDGQGHHGWWKVDDMNNLFSGLVDYLQATPFASVAISQGGDHIGGADSTNVDAIKSKRKAMNSFICDTQKPFKFVGRVNEDVNTYTCEQRKGVSFITFLAPQLVQKISQTNEGGMTELYLETGTYLKSFYSVMYAPSCVTVSSMRNPQSSNGGRLHHKVNWNACAPKIIRETHRKAKS